jgi:hypothetical protein
MVSAGEPTMLAVGLRIQNEPGPRGGRARDVVPWYFVGQEQDRNAGAVGGVARTTDPGNVSVYDVSREREKGAARPDSGFKIGAFYANIVNPRNAEPVTVDRHAIAICLGHPPDEGEQQLTGYRYRCYAAAYRLVAEERGMVPSEVQAITWAAYRRYTGDLHQSELPF